MASVLPHVSVVAMAESSLNTELIPAITRGHEYANLLREHAVVTTSVIDVDFAECAPSPTVSRRSARRGAHFVFVVGPQQAHVRAHIEVGAQQNGCLALFEDDAIAAVVAVRAMSAAETFSHGLGRTRVAVVASTWSATISSVLLAVGARDVVTWSSREVPAMSCAEALASHDIIVNPTMREVLHSPVPSHVVRYPREELAACGFIVPPLIGTLCDSDAPSIGIDIWVAVARALSNVTEPDMGPDWDDLALFIAAFVRRALKTKR